jgi:NADPH-dependent 2,4-dienoyl-CoA reductase/sulfur reductase-like enzyme
MWGGPVSIDSADWDNSGATATIWRGDRPVYDRGRAVCVIGAGASGLTAIKNLREQGFAVDCYERETGVGGAWNWRHDRSPVYASTHLVSSKPFTQFPDFPMPDDWPDYPHHSQVRGYLERYAEHFRLREHIWFGSEVVRVEPVDGDYWDVTTQVGHRERTSRYAAVVVANGHNWSPNLPHYDGLAEFRGEVIHASGYKDPTQLRGRKVLVVGAGNSGCDIAVEAAQQAAQCWHSSRRGYWYAPKFVHGRPADQLNDRLLRLRLPLRLRQWLFERTLRRQVGDLTRFGLAAPDHRLYETHPIVNSQLVYYAGHGAIRPVPDVARFERQGVVLTDGRTIEPDLVVLATGYLPRFEFLTPEVLNLDADGRPRLYLHTFPRRHPTLAVAGLVQSDSGLLPVAHWQSVAVARWLRLRETDPGRASAFWRQAAAAPDQRFTAARTKGSSRHWFEIDHVDYLRALQKTLDQLALA